jgi:hypothetical protein
VIHPHDQPASTRRDGPAAQPASGLVRRGRPRDPAHDQPKRGRLATRSIRSAYQRAFKGKSITSGDGLSNGPATRSNARSAQRARPLLRDPGHDQPSAVGWPRDPARSSKAGRLRDPARRDRAGLASVPGRLHDQPACGHERQAGTDAPVRAKTAHDPVRGLRDSHTMRGYAPPKKNSNQTLSKLLSCFNLNPLTNQIA